MAVSLTFSRQCVQVEVGEDSPIAPSVEAESTGQLMMLAY